MTDKEGRYKGLIRPFVTFTEKEDAEIEKYLADLRVAGGTKIAKSDFITSAVMYCVKKKVNPTV